MVVTKAIDPWLLMFTGMNLQCTFRVSQVNKTGRKNSFYNISSITTFVLPACRRLLFPLLHAEKGRPFSACNKGNRRRLHAGDLRIEWCELLKRYVSRLLNKRNSHTGKCSPCLVVSSTFAHKKTKLRQVETRHQNVVRTLAWFKQRFLGKKSRTFQGLFFTTF